MTFPGQSDEPAQDPYEPAQDPYEPAQDPYEPEGDPDRAGEPMRDRDPSGRARNARPRDELGRPLPRSAPGELDARRIPDDLAVTPAEAAELGGRLLAEGRPFHAHEVFEAAWKSTPAPDRELWRGLAQIAVGLTHARRGNARGAAALLRRGAGHVREHPANDAGVEAASVSARAEEVAARIERDGLAAVAESDLRLSLREP